MPAMKQINTNLTRTTTRLAGIVGGLIALSLPLAFFILALQFNLAAMHEEARYSATNISRMISANPQFWQFEEPRLQELIKDQTETDLPELRRIVDKAGRIVAQSFESTEATASAETKESTESRESLDPLDALAVTRSADLMDAGTVVGRYEVIRNLRPLLLKTALVGLLGLFLGTLVMLVLRVYPLRALKRTLETLANEKERAERTLQAIGDAVVTIDGQGTVLLFNPAAEKMFGFAAAEVIGHNVQMLMPEAYRKKHEDAMRNYPDTGQTRLFSFEREVKAQRSNGEIFPVGLRISAFYLEGQRQFIGSMRDITARKQAELTLTGTYRALQMLSRSSMAINRVDDEAHMLAEVCRVAIEVGSYRMAWVGYAQNDVARSILPMAHAGDTKGYLTSIKVSWCDTDITGNGPAGLAIRSGQPQHRSDMGSDRGFYWQGAAFESGYRSCIVLPLRDAGRNFGVLCLYAGQVQQFAPEEVTLLQDMADNLAFGIVSLRARLERRRSAEAIRQASVKLHEQASLIDLTQDAILVRNLDGTLRFWNKGAERLYGWSAAEVLGKTMKEVMYRDPHTLGAVIEKILAADGDWTGELEKVARDGSPVHVEMRCTVVRDENGRPNGVMAVNTDIRERKRAREEILQLNASLEDRVEERTAQLKFANQQLEAFSYSVSHDLRSPLNAINGFGHLLEKSLIKSGAAPLSERSGHYLARIRAGVAQMGELIDAMLSLAQVSRSSLRWEPVDLSAQAQALLLALQEREPGRVVQLNVQAGLQAQGDPRLLRQVLDNLLGNAWKFTARQACGRITVGQQAGSAGEAVYFVRDNGAGFDMAYAQKLFAAFQRLHTEAEFAGTGIGLATVQRIVARHGGRVWAEAALGRGATFYFTLGTQTL
jgi:PAS domain S-box-containing protein